MTAISRAPLLLCLLTACGGVTTRVAGVPMRDGATLATTTLSRRSLARQPTIIVLHGGPAATHSYLRPEWDRLASVGRVVYYDQRGCGASTRRGPNSWQRHVRDLDDLIQRVAPGERLIIAGSSWGSWLGLLYTYEHQERVAALVLSGTVPWPGTGRQLTTRRDSLFAGLVKPDTIVALDTLSRMRMPLLKANGTRAGDRVIEGCPSAGIWPGSFATGPDLPSLRRITTPTLFIAGTDTTRLPDGSAPLVRVLPNARRVLLDGAGHDPWLDDPDRFFAEVRSFLATVKK